MGRHHKPSSTGKHLAAAATITTLTMPAVAGVAEAAEAPAAGPLDIIAQCESGGNPKAQNPSSTASGLYQIIDGTWRAHRGTEFAPTAAEATPEQQLIVAQRIVAAAGGAFTAWNASKTCWGGKIAGPAPASAAAPKAAAPKVAAASERVHPLPTGRITSRFKEAGRPNHLGLDLAASTGTPVRAAADGTVTTSGWSNGGYGNLVIIKHAGGIETRYAHLSKLGKTGKVKAGDVIGYVGSTGDSTGPHLHFEVRDGGTAINPEVWLRGASKAAPAPAPKRDTLNCDDFQYQEDAQAKFDEDKSDPHKLDQGGEPGVACEALPHRPATAAKKPSVESHQALPKVTPRVTVPDSARFTPGGDGEYVVEPGDTLSQLAVDHLPEMVRERGINATVDHLVEVNRDIVEMPGWIFVGERLHLR